MISSNCLPFYTYKSSAVINDKSKHVKCFTKNELANMYIPLESLSMFPPLIKKLSILNHPKFPDYPFYKKCKKPGQLTKNDALKLLYTGKLLPYMGKPFMLSFDEECHKK